MCPPLFNAAAACRLLFLLLLHPGEVRAQTPAGALPHGPGTRVDPARPMPRFTPDAGLEVELVAAEPDVAQPVYLTFDERGRMWVVQYLQYPFPAGLKVVGHDEYWRVQYDQFPPPPPPHHPRGADKVTIFEDKDGNGTFESHKDFVTGLNITTAALPGKDGVWIMNPPYLLFYPDADHDDVPDGAPAVHLAGFGLEDMHAVASSLTWGPDGWLYGCQGSTCTASITRPGLDKSGLDLKGQFIFRYQPETRRFEVFAEGGYNNFGIALDEQGRLFTGSNGGIIGVHYVQGGYYRKHFPKHGPFTNPYTFGHVEGMSDHSSKAKLSQAMTFCGPAWPPDYRNAVLVARVLQQRIDLCEFRPDGSSYSAHERSPALASTDPNFRPVDLKPGPDGAVYIADWHEPNVTWNVTAGEGGLHAASGRIYRLKPRGTPSAGAFDFTKLTSAQLLEKLLHPIPWHRDMARRLMRQRRDSALVAPLTERLVPATGQTALELLWALHACGGFTPDLAASLLHHADPLVRAWTIRLLGDDRSTSPDTGPAMLHLARSETDPQVRSQLACTVRRLNAAIALPVTEALAHHAGDAGDPNIPLLLWYNVEDKLRTERGETMSWLGHSPLWEAPLFQSAILARLGQRFTTERSRENLEICAHLMAVAPGLKHKRELLRGMALGLAGEKLDHIPAALEARFRELWATGPPDAGLIEVAVRLGSQEATPMALQLINDASAGEPERTALLRLLAERREPLLLDPVMALLCQTPSATLRNEALAALQPFSEERAGQTVLGQALRYDDSWRHKSFTILSSRPSWAALLLAAVDSGTVRAREVPRGVVLALQNTAGEKNQALITQHWGTLQQTPQAKRQHIAELTKLLTGGTGDAPAGKSLFTSLCSSCHTLHGEGRKAGPDLTGIDRGNLDGLLHAIVDPGASVLPDYMAFHLQLKAGAGEEERRITGFIQAETTNGLTITDLAGNRTAVAKSDITARTALTTSIMPESLLEALTPRQVRDLFAWLQSNPEKQ